MRRAVEADTGSLTQSLAGKFTPTEELEMLTTETNERVGALFDRVKDALRPGIEVLDLPPISSAPNPLSGDHARRAPG